MGGRRPDGVYGSAYGGSYFGVVYLGPKAEGEVVREEEAAGLLSVVSTAGSAAWLFGAVREYDQVVKRDGRIFGPYRWEGGGRGDRRR